MEYIEILNKVKNLVKEVGEYQLKHHRKNNFLVDTKLNISDLVSEVDRQSEKMIMEFLSSNYPDHSILGEETGERNNNSPYKWVIDPLDGTNNYVAGLPIFSISIALYYQDHAVLGIVYAPYLDELYWAIKEEGAFFNNQKICVSSAESLNECILGTGFPYDKCSHPVNNLEYINNIVPEIRGLRRMGSAAYDLCCVASGTLDGYWELNLKIWDIAAGKLILEEAGGVVKNFREDRGISILCGNKIITQKIINCLEKRYKIESFGLYCLFIGCIF